MQPVRPSYCCWIVCWDHSVSRFNTLCLPNDPESSGLFIHKGQGHVTCGSCKCELQHKHSLFLSVTDKHVPIRSISEYLFHPAKKRLQMTPSRWRIEGEGLATSIFIASRRANSQAVRLDVLDLHSLGQPYDNGVILSYVNYARNEVDRQILRNLGWFKYCNRWRAQLFIIPQLLKVSCSSTVLPFRSFQ